MNKICHSNNLKVRVWIIIAFFSILLFFAANQAAAYVDNKKIEPIGKITRKVPETINTIVIDPGHGGKDFGAIGKRGLREKCVTLDVAKKLKGYLEAEGFKVLLTREKDEFVALQDRADMVNKFNADLFISIHVNASKNRSARGYETFYLSHPMNDYFDNNILTGDGYVKYENFMDYNSEIGKIYLKLLDSASSEDRSFSIKLADNIHQSLRNFIRSRDRGIKRARFFVLKNTVIPAVLVEVGFLSNPKEEFRISKNFYRDKIAKGIVKGVVSFRDFIYGLNRTLGLKQAAKSAEIK